VVYTGATLAFVPLLRALAEGTPGAIAATGFVLLPLLTTWAGDTTAYFAGRAWGRARLAPAVSPGKTVVGAVAGLAGSTGAAMALSAALLGSLPGTGVGLLTSAWIGLLLGAAGQLGDLTESMLKREAGVKDSGTLLAGHGGMLDRIDSLLFAIPTTWGLLFLAGVLT
jgi:phosphatidate cytidylyltransferase